MTAFAPPPCQPPLPVLRELIHKEGEVQRVISYVVEDAVLRGTTGDANRRVDEVGTLACFFVHGLPRLQALLNARLQTIQITIKGVFCHKSGKLGPVVAFDTPERRCELSDLLLLVTHGNSSTGSPAWGNAVFLQAKSDRLPLVGASTINQRQLYSTAERFTFTEPTKHASARWPDNTPAGLREMPAMRNQGFKFWFFDAPYRRLYWNYTTAAAPAFLDFPQLDKTFTELLFDLMIGNDGLGVSTPATNEFGWNRIVRDVIARAISEKLGTRKVVSPESLRRINPPLNGNQLLGLFGDDDTVAVLNPFGDLSSWFGDDQIRGDAAKLAGESRLTDEEIKKAMGGEPPDIPPPDKPTSENNGSGGSFIWIDISKKQD